MTWAIPFVVTAAASGDRGVCHLSVFVPSEFPYMASVANVSAILDKIKVAGVPPRFTDEFLKASLGFGSSNDRNVIKVLKLLGFLTADSVPTARYHDFRHEQRSGAVLAEGHR